MLEKTSETPEGNFNKMRKAGLTIKQSKCKFTRNECEYLRHTVGNGKVHRLQAKVQAVQDFTQPITKKDVRAFLGLCGYYRRFIPDFSTIATSLTELTRKDKPNIIFWGKETQQSFQHLKDSLTHYPMLATPCGRGLSYCKQTLPILG